MYSELIRTLQNAGLKLTPGEIADALWLASHLDFSNRPTSAIDDRIARRESESAETNRSSEANSTEGGQNPKPGLEKDNENGSLIDIASAKTPLYNRLSASAKRDSIPLPATEFPTPTPSPLPNALNLARSLRPLKRYVPSRNYVVMDEEATAERIAETHIANATNWMPVIVPEQERWLDAVVVIDQSSNMLIWHETLAEFVTILEHLGAFQRIQVWGFRHDAASDHVELYPTIHGNYESETKRSPQELVDPQGRRSIFVISDCVAPIWYNRAFRLRHFCNNTIVIVSLHIAECTH